MKLLGKVLIYIFSIIAIILVALFAYYKISFPAVSQAEDIKIEITEQRLERGKYLFNNVALCGDCHTTRDWSKFTAPIKEEYFASGNFDEFTKTNGFPGDFYASNLTPDNMLSWTDGEILRAVTEGVSKDGRALFPVMPYQNFGKMDKEDIYSIIAYMRTLPSISRETPESKATFPMNIIINTIPQKANFTTIPPKSDKVKYGQYVTNAAGCYDCHTQTKKGKALPGMEFAGGFEFHVATGGIVRSANITPDKSTGIGDWSMEYFVDRFKSYSDSVYTPASVSPNHFNTWMPWTKYADMETEDLEAIYNYLMSLKAVNNNVKVFEESK